MTQEARERRTTERLQPSSTCDTTGRATENPSYVVRRKYGGSRFVVRSRREAVEQVGGRVRFWYDAESIRGPSLRWTSPNPDHHGWPFSLDRWVDFGATAQFSSGLVRSFLPEAVDVRTVDAYGTRRKVPFSQDDGSLPKIDFLLFSILAPLLLASNVHDRPCTTPPTSPR